MSDIGESFKSKLGPFPVWVWGLIIGGAFVAFYWFSQGSRQTTDDTGEGSGTVATPSGDFSTVPVLPTTDADKVQDEATNGEWLIQAVQAVANSGVSFVAAQAALMKYLNGQTLTDAEGQIVNRALSIVGLPPEGTMGTPDITPAPETPEAPQPNFATKTTLKVAKTRRFGQPLIMQASVNWQSSKGHVGRPNGSVVFTVDGVDTKSVRVVNGGAVSTLMMRKGLSRLKDGTLVVTASFRPFSSARTEPSQSSPAIVRVS